MLTHVKVGAAVSAVTSAFHGASELMNHIKTKQRVTAAQTQEFERKQLHDSRILGEQQISLQYDQDMHELGELVRVGDGIVLWHPTTDTQLT